MNAVWIVFIAWGISSGVINAISMDIFGGGWFVVEVETWKTLVKVIGRLHLVLGIDVAD